MAAADKCYTYRTVSKSGAVTYHYSVRAGNDNTNSIGSGKYQSRQGRNAWVRKEQEKRRAAKKKLMQVIQGRPGK